MKFPHYVCRKIYESQENVLKSQNKLVNQEFAKLKFTKLRLLLNLQEAKQKLYHVHGHSHKKYDVHPWESVAY